ncbi:hypothetical protein [Hyalangium gracile]|uniref:hypothetical protein n=1 Tax=Hyalangium gracile TaxID=394092 RepID=UPI001CCCB86F|nr:hypothetical protein [Hyalangium gracile]
MPRLLSLLLCVMSPLPSLGQPPKSGAPATSGACRSEALVLGTGTRDVADSSELVGGDGVPDLVLAVRTCRGGPLKSVEVSSADGKLLWDTSASYNETWNLLIASQQEPERLLPRERFLQDSVPLAGGREAPPSKGLELALYVSADGAERQAFQGRPGKVSVAFQDGFLEEIAFSPAPSPLPPQLAALLKGSQPAPLVVLQDYESQDARRQFDAVLALAGAVKQLDPKQTLPVFERYLRTPRTAYASPDLVRGATARALRVLGPQALPLAPLLIESFHDVDSDVVLQKRRALLAMGPGVAPALLAAPAADRHVAVELFDLIEPREERYVRLLPLLHAKEERVASTAASLVSCEHVATRSAWLQRAAKEPAALEAARRALEHPSEDVRQAAAAVTALAGDRGDKTRRALSEGYMHCRPDLELQRSYAELLAKFPPENASEQLVIAVVTGGTPVGTEEGRAIIEPLLQFHQGQWKQALSRFMAGPKQWYGLERSWETKRIKRVGALPTKTKPVEFASDCGNKGWGFPMSAPLKAPDARLAFSQDITLSPFEPATPAQVKALQRLLEDQDAEVFQRARKEFQQKNASQCTAELVAALKERPDMVPSPGGNLQNCTAAQPGFGRLCYTRKFRTYAVMTEEGAPACMGTCVSEVWTVDSGAGPRALTTTHHCDTDEKDIGGGSPPFLVFTRDERLFILADNTCYEGCDGFQVFEATPTGVRGLTSKDSDAACD